MLGLVDCFGYHVIFFFLHVHFISALAILLGREALALINSDALTVQAPATVNLKKGRESRREACHLVPCFCGHMLHKVGLVCEYYAGAPWDPVRGKISSPL